MAGAGQPFYMPLMWPVGHVMSALSRPDAEKAPKPSATPSLDLTGHLTSCMAATVRLNRVGGARARARVRGRAVGRHCVCIGRVRKGRVGAPLCAALWRGAAPAPCLA
jgi:hypothetical protein